MKRFLTTVSFLVFVFALAAGLANAQQTASGDKKMDGYLNQINKEAEQDPEGFTKHLSQQYGIAEEEIRQAREQHRLTYGDTYMAAALAKQSQRKIGDVAAQYKQKQSQGQGWGVTAQENGVKAGSAQFHQMKTQAKGSVKQLKAQNRHRMRVNEKSMGDKTRSEGSKKKSGQQAQGQSSGKGKGKKK